MQMVHIACTHRTVRFPTMYTAHTAGRVLEDCAHRAIMIHVPGWWFDTSLWLDTS